jgi:hypothetical protein
MGVAQAQGVAEIALECGLSGVSKVSGQVEESLTDMTDTINNRFG